MVLLIAACLVVQVDVESLVGQLDAPSWRAREAATMAIAQAHGELSPDELSRRLIEELLTPEQRTRIIMALERRLLLLPKGALGVRMKEWGPDNKEAPQQGVRIIEVVAGLPAHGIFRPGDVITHMDDEPLRISADLIQIVQSHWPGDKLQIRAQRPDDGKWVELNIVVTLGSMDQLTGQGALQRPPPLQDVNRFLQNFRRTHGPLVRTLARPAEPGRGSAAWIVREVARQRTQLAEHPEPNEQAVFVARWTTWLKAVDSKLGDRFLDQERRAALGQAREALEAAIGQFGSES